MSGFHSAAIDPALLSSPSVGGAISPSQLIASNRPGPSAPNIHHHLSSSALASNPAPGAAALSQTNHPSGLGSLASARTSSLPSPLPAPANPFASAQSSLSPLTALNNQHSSSNNLFSNNSNLSHPSASLSHGASTSSFINGTNDSSQQPLTSSSDLFVANGISYKEHEMHQKDQELAQFLLKMEDYKPVIPDEVAGYYLERVGFTSNDVRLKRLLVLACQKFISDIAEDAFSYASTRTGQAPGGRQGQVLSNANSTGVNHSGKKDRTRTVLTQEDLTQALAEYGINASRATYYL